MLGSFVKQKTSCAALHGSLYLLIKLSDLLGDILLSWVLNLSDHFEALALESDKFAAKTEAGTASWLKPLGSVWCTGLLAR